jgi:hypothetical protein
MNPETQVSVVYGEGYSSRREKGDERPMDLVIVDKINHAVGDILERLSIKNELDLTALAFVAAQIAVLENRLNSPEMAPILSAPVDER